MARFAAVVLLCLAVTTAHGSAQVAAETCFGAAATIVGTEANDSILGTAGADVIVTLGGDDSVVALGGNDRICTGAGSDGVLGEDGDDSIEGGDGGSDVAYYFTASRPVQVNLATVSQQGQPAVTRSPGSRARPGRTTTTLSSVTQRSTFSTEVGAPTDLTAARAPMDSSAGRIFRPASAGASSSAATQ